MNQAADRTVGRQTDADIHVGIVDSVGVSKRLQVADTSVGIPARPTKSSAHRATRLFSAPGLAAPHPAPRIVAGRRNKARDPDLARVDDADIIVCSDLLADINVCHSLPPELSAPVALPTIMSAALATSPTIAIDKPARALRC